MENFKLNYNNVIEREYLDKLTSVLSEYKGKEFVMFCVGNSKIWYDCFGPFMAEVLRSQPNFNCYIYGGVNFNITPETLPIYTQFVKHKHPSACVVVLDSKLVAQPAESGQIEIFKRSTNMAGLAGGYLFGDVSVLATVCPLQNGFYYLNNLQNKLVKLAEDLGDALQEIDNVDSVCKNEQNVKYHNI